MHFLIALPGSINRDELDLAAESVLLQELGLLLGVVTGTVRTPGLEDLVRDERGASGEPA